MLLHKDAKVLVARKNKSVLLDDGRIVKVFKDSKPAADVFNEALNISRVQELVSCPKIQEVSVVEGDEYSGSWALATDYIEGENLESLLGDSEGESKALDILVSTQIGLHAISAPLLNRMRDKLVRQIKSCENLDESLRYDLLMRCDGISASTRICHGDLVFSNVIINEGEPVAVCDWAHVTAGNPAVDAATSYLQLQLEHPELKDAYLERFCKASDIPAQLVHYWVPVVAAAELSRKRGLHTEELQKLIQVGDFM